MRRVPHSVRMQTCHVPMLDQAIGYMLEYYHPHVLLLKFSSCLFVLNENPHDVQLGVWIRSVLALCW